MFWNSGKKKDVEAPQPPQPLLETTLEKPLSPHEQELAVRFGKVRSALSTGTIIQGKLSFDCAVRIDGRLSGELYSSDSLILGESSKVDASVEAKTIIVLGKASGKFKASDTIEIHTGATFSGTLEAPAIRVDDGASVRATITMVNKKKI